MIIEQKMELDIEHSITVKPAQMADYNDVERFYCELIDSMHDAEFKPEWEMGVYPTEQFLRDSIKERTLLLAHLGNNLVGIMILNHDCSPEYESVNWQVDAKKSEVMVIHTLGVSQAHQGKGIARQMVSIAIEMCKKGAIKAIRLDVLKKNIPAAKLYLSLGFQCIATVKMYYEDTGLADFQLYELVL